MATRNTVQQRIIGEHLRALGNHPTVDEVYGAVRAERPSISKATVYRVLHKMADAGDALRVPVVGGAERFDHRVDSHSHVVCMRCGHVADVEPSTIGCIDVEAVQAASNYASIGYELQFRGVCPDCQAETELSPQAGCAGDSNDG